MKCSWSLLTIVLITNVAIANAAEQDPPNMPGEPDMGKTLYDRACLPCHGIDGKGDGPAAFYNSAYSAPRPRDFTVGNYRFRSTMSGTPPTDQDLFRIITEGIPGYMPSFSGVPEHERWQIISYMKTFAPETFEDAPQLIALPDQPTELSSNSVKKGRMLYVELDCRSCHGENGRWDGNEALREDLKDENDLPIIPTDLTSLSAYKNGALPRDIVRTLLTGLDGTPMPSYASQFEGRENEVWHLANYLLSLAPSP